MRHNSLDRQEDALDVDIKDTLPLVLGDVERRLVGVRGARVVDEHVDPAKARHGQVDGGSPVRGAGDVETAEEHRRRAVRGDLLAGCLVDVGHQHAAALVGEAAGDGGAEPRRRA